MKIQIFFIILSFFLQNSICLGNRGVSNDILIQNRRNANQINFRDDLNKKIVQNRQQLVSVVVESLRPPTDVPQRDNDQIPTISSMCTPSSSIKTRFMSGYKLGQGAFGEVRSVEGWAIKQIRTKGGLADKTSLAKEIFHLKKLKNKNNPNLPYLVDCYTEKNNGTNPIYIQQQKLYSNIDYDSKRNSKGYLFLKHFSFEKRVQIWIEWLKTLKAIHDLGYVHLDIKPDNVMTTANFDVVNQDNFHLVFIDFGLMKKIKDYYEIGHTVFFHPSVHGARKNIAVVPSFDVYQACLTMFVVENYRNDTVRKSNQRDAYDLFSLSRLDSSQFSDYFKILKKNIWNRFDLKKKMEGVNSVSDCKDFYCVISFGIKGDVNQIPKLTSMINKLESLYPLVKEQEEFDIETVVQRESRKDLARQNILKYAKNLKNLEKQNNEFQNVPQIKKKSNQEPVVQKKQGVFQVKKSNYFDDIAKKGLPVRAIHLNDDIPKIRQALEDRIAAIDKIAVPSQSNEEKLAKLKKPSNQFDMANRLRKPPSNLQRANLVRKPSNQIQRANPINKIPSGQVPRIVLKKPSNGLGRLDAKNRAISDNLNRVNREGAINKKVNDFKVFI